MTSYSILLMIFKAVALKLLNSILYPFKLSLSLQMYTTFLDIYKSKAMVLCCDVTIR